MTGQDVTSVLDRQLMLQLGERLKRLRHEKGLGSVELAARVGMTRNTLRAIEAGDPGPSLGNYVRVMSALGVSGDLALLAADTLHPAPVGSAAARSLRPAPMVRVEVLADQGRHRIQDLQSMALHEAAVNLAKDDPRLIEQAIETAEKWLQNGDQRSAGLWREWVDVLRNKSWRKVLGRTRGAQQLRQASPLVTVLPGDVRQAILDQVAQLRRGVVISGADVTR